MWRRFFESGESGPHGSPGRAGRLYRAHADQSLHQIGEALGARPKCRQACEPRLNPRSVGRPDEARSNVQERQEVGVLAVVASGDAAPLLQASEAALDRVACPVDRAVEGPVVLATARREGLSEFLCTRRALLLNATDGERLQPCTLDAAQHQFRLRPTRSRRGIYVPEIPRRRARSISGHAGAFTPSQGAKRPGKTQISAAVIVR